MTGLIEIGGILDLNGLGMILGWRFSRLRAPWWLAGYVIPMALVGAVAVCRIDPGLSFRPPFIWITRGRIEFVLLAAAITMMFMTLLPRLHHPRTRRLLMIFMALAAPYYSLIPFLGPLLVRHELESVSMTLFPGGICIQSTGYTCGPAAAVSALWQLGIMADEGELARLAYTNPFSGTPEDLLLDAIQRRYGELGVECDYRQFQSVDDLRRAGLTIALIKFRFMIDHYVTVFSVEDDTVLLADPAEGIQRITIDQFLRVWKKTGITIHRQGYHYEPPDYLRNHPNP